MRRFRAWSVRFAGLFNKRRKDCELAEEIESHLQMHTEDNLRRGLSPEEARRQAMIKLGGIESTKEACRDQRGLPVLETLLQDVRYGARMLRKNPGFAAVAVLTLAIGIGANTSIFTVTNTLMLRSLSLPVRDPQELVQASVFGVSGRNYTFTYPGYERLRDGTRSLSGLFAAGIVGQSQIIASGMGETETEVVRSQPVTGNFFGVLDVQPFVGRLLSPADDLPKSAERVVVISHGFWQRRFGKDPSLVGKAITLFGVPVTIVGVTPPGFFGVQPGENPDLWLPINLMSLLQPQALGEGYDWLGLIGRLHSGTDIRKAESELAVAFQQYHAEGAAAMGPEDSKRLSQERLELQSAGAGWTRLRDQFRLPLTILTAVVGLVLLVACANFASLMLARAVSRTREFSIRAAMGAHRLRLIRQLLTESVLLAGLGGLFGLLLAHWGARLLVSFVGVQPDPVSFNLAPDARVVCFTMSLSLATGLVFGLAPALQSSRSNVATTMKGAGASIAGSRQFLQQSLVVAQVALSLVLLVGAGLFVRTLQKLKGMDMGFSRESVALFEVRFDQRVDLARRVSAYRQLLARLEETAGVRTASMSRMTPLTENTWGQQLDIEGYAPALEEKVRCSGMSVASRYFETMGTPLLSGRDFGPQDERSQILPATNAPGVAIINETMARKYFGNASPLHRRFSFFGNADRRFEVVGVVKDAKYRSLREPVPPTFYVFCFAEMSDWDMTFVVRTARKSATSINGLRRAVREADPVLQLRGIRTMDAVVNDSLRLERVIANLGGCFSLTALALACLGLYGTLSFSVAQETREIGVRTALGAQPLDVLLLVIRKGLKLAVIGSMIGLVGALAAARLVSGLLYGVSSTDPVTFVGVALLLVIVALLASWLPARRAAKADPMVALRYE
jgi:predicted permease